LTRRQGKFLTDAQILTLALAVVIPLSLLTYSNSRITEAKETLRAESAELRTEMHGANTALRGDNTTLRAEMAELRTEVRAGFERIEMLSRSRN
jgi:hypothetical protein